MAELVIKINGDIKNLKDAFDKVEKQTESLTESLDSLGKKSAIGFAALSAAIGYSVHKFGEAEASSNKLNLALQNQGIFSKNLVGVYGQYAESISRVTGLQDDELTGAQATLQSLIGQTEITQELTLAMADLSTKTGSLESAASILGRGIEGNTRGFKQFGITIDENLSKQERMKQILEQVNLKVGGQAELANKGVGSFKGLSTAVSKLVEDFGAEFAPIVVKATKHLTDFFYEVSEHKDLVRLAAVLIGAATAFTGITTALVAASKAFLIARSAFAAFSIVAGAAASPILLVAGALVAVSGAIAYFTLKGNEAGSSLNALDLEIKNTRESISKLELQLSKPNPLAAFFSTDEIKQKLADAQSHLSDLEERARRLSAAEGTEKQQQDPDKKAAADKEATEKAASEQRRLDVIKANNQLIILEESGASEEVLILKKQESEILSQIEDDKNAAIREKLSAHLEETRAEIEIAQATELEQAMIFNNEILLNNEEFQMLSAEQKRMFLEQNQQALQAQQMTESQAQIQAAKIRAQEQTKANNQYLMDQQKFGAAYAAINQAMHSAVFQGSKQAFGELAQLTQSSNATLKGIGKVAALANIVIKTAESAMNIFNGFSTIPIIGVPLGIAGAAAAVAFGAEQYSKVNQAADGGLLQGGIRGIDSIPVLAQQGELISPAQNFEEVIGSVRAAREAENRGLTLGDTMSGGGGSNVNVSIGFDGKEASQVLTARQIEDESLGISQRG